VLAQKVRRIQNVEEADIQQFIDSHAAELTDEELEKLSALSEPEDEGDSATVVERLQIITSALEKRRPGGE
jgi:succinate dehydrogenase flavin-adding protein (antitoxin of CptAB toxin-antitoxin module)